MNKKTMITAITSVIAFILLVINTIAGTNIEIAPDVLTSIATLIFAGIMWFISNYWNQDYSHVAMKITPIMRKIKILEKNGDLRLLDQIENLIAEWEDGDENDND